MLRSMTEFVFTPHWNQDVRSIPHRCGKLTGASAGRTLMPCGEVRVLVGAEQLVAADAERVVPAVAVLGAERLRLDDELHRAEAVQLVHQERPVGDRHAQAGEHAPARHQALRRRGSRPSTCRRRARARLLDDRVVGQRDELDAPPAIQEAQAPLAAAGGRDGLVHDPLHEGVDVGHRRPAVHPERAAVVVQLADVAGRAVQAHHLLPGDLPVACRHADRQPVRVVACSAGRAGIRSARCSRGTADR